MTPSGGLSIGTPMITPEQNAQGSPNEYKLLLTTPMGGKTPKQTPIKTHIKGSKSLSCACAIAPADDFTDPFGELLFSLVNSYCAN